MKRRRLLNSLNKSLSELHENHRYLSNEVREQASTFHLARYLYQNLNIAEKDNLELDIEYDKRNSSEKGEKTDNKVMSNMEILDKVLCQIENLENNYVDLNYDNVEPNEWKSLRNEDLRSNQDYSKRPDIIIHERGKQRLNNFVTEVKMEKNRLQVEDAAKVLYLTHPGTKNESYYYRYGALIPLEKNDLQKGLIWIKNGKVQNCREINI